MKRIILILSSAILLMSCSRDRYIVVTGFAQGGTYSVKINMSGVLAAPDAVKSAIDSIFKEVDNTLSGYNKSSLLSRYNAGEEVKLNDMFLDILELSDKYKEETGGAFDAGAAPLFDVWGFGFTRDSLPDPVRIQEALALNGTKLNFNAIAQGYTCDLIAGYLRSLGVKDMLVDIGEIYCQGLNPQHQAWTIGIDTPIDGNDTPGEKLQGIHKCGTQSQGIVTSGNYRKYYVQDGKKYAHTIDPRTGYPVDHSLLSATIMAPDATAADAYATYCMVIGLEKSIEFIESRPDLEAYLIYDEDSRMKSWVSSGFEVTSF